jgi:circadian clock protein KaiC
MEGIGERNRGLSIVKARGMAHSNQVREFVITGQGIRLLEVYVGAAGIVTGSARQAHQLEAEARDKAFQNELDRKDRELERKRKVLEATIANLRTEFESVEEELKRINLEEKKQMDTLSEGRKQIGRFTPANGKAGPGRKKK